MRRVRFTSNREIACRIVDIKISKNADKYG